MSGSGPSGPLVRLSTLMNRGVWLGKYILLLLAIAARGGTV